jgi:hypothetical protein
MPRNIVFAIDVEPDPIRYGPDESWEGTAITLRELSALRNRIQQRTGMPFRLNWFARFDRKMERAWGPDWVPQAWLLNTAHSNGDFIGVQVHLWKWQHDRGWYNDSSNPDWRTECLNSAIEGFRGLLGDAPTASRFGDRNLLQRDIQPLRDSGIHYDLTLEPSLASGRKSSNVVIPDAHHEVPRKPYRPSTINFLQPQYPPSDLPADQDLWLLPLTLTKRPQWVRVKGAPFFVRKKLPLNLVLRPRGVWSQLSSEINRDTTEPIVIALRSGDLADPFFLGNLRLVLENLAQSPRLPSVRFVGAEQAVAAFAKSQEGGHG